RSKRDWSSDVCSSDLSGVSRAWTHVLGAVSKQLIDATTKVSPNLHMGDEGVDLGALEQFSPCHVTTSRPSPALVATSRAVFPYRSEERRVGTGCRVRA